MPENETAQDITILVEFPDRPGVRAVSLKDLSTEELAEKSAQALDKAMDTVRGMAVRSVKAVKDLTDPPDNIEVEFGIKLDAEAGAMVAKASTEASFNVTLTWQREVKTEAKVPAAGFIPSKKK
jgi:hypothetical protein